METTRNRTFLRAFVQDPNGSSAVPVPHTTFEPPRRGTGPIASEPSDTRPRTAPRVAFDAPSGSRRLENGTDASRRDGIAVPSPHVQFPSTGPFAAGAGVSSSVNDAAFAASWYEEPTLLVGAAFPISGRLAGVPAGLPAERAAREARDADPDEDAAHGAGLIEAPGTPESIACGDSTVHDASGSPCAEPRGFVANWEVDRFRWPRDCERLHQQMTPAFDEAGSQLRAATLDGMRLLAVTSGLRGEGRTTVAMLLARAAARAGVRVALIDADAKNPRIGRQLHIELEHDWRDAARGIVPEAEAGIASLDESIAVFPLTDNAREESVLPNDGLWQRFWTALGAYFDLVILDCGPTDDQHPFQAFRSANAAIVVRDARATDEPGTRRVIEQLVGGSIEAIGIIDNYVRTNAA
ncbi:MAG: hypothetical protein FJ297_10885 [Planctomycetes bacterium]|nr:hypothetical protein [Planctomycetota bacterium]